MPSSSFVSGKQKANSGGKNPRTWKKAELIFISDWNKKGTNGYNGDESAKGDLMARQLGIDRVWRRVVDFGDPKSTGIGDSWGYKRVSVPRVSFIDNDLNDAGVASGLSRHSRKD